MDFFVVFQTGRKATTFLLTFKNNSTNIRDIQKKTYIAIHVVYCRNSFGGLGKKTVSTRITKMPETTHTNGYTNGHNASGLYEMEDKQSFLFTSESVGEGHPGK